MSRTVLDDLPEPRELVSYSGNVPFRYYTADQMRGYAKAAIAAIASPTEPAGVEERAREVFAAEFERDGESEWAAAIRSGNFDLEGEYPSQMALRAIAAALRQPVQGDSARVVLLKAIERARVFDDGSDGADAESARSVVALLTSLLTTPTTAQPKTSKEMAEALEWLTLSGSVPPTIRSTFKEAIAAYDPDRMARCGNTVQTKGEDVGRTDVACWTCGAPCVETTRTMLGEDMQPETVRGRKYTPTTGQEADARDAAMFAWLAKHPNLYTVTDLLRADQYVTLRRACEALMPIDAASEASK